jgi:hypothetical protein
VSPDHPLLALATTIFVLFTLLAGPARAEDSDGSLLLYAVDINQGAHHRTGAGIYLGDGYVLKSDEFGPGRRRWPIAR